MAERKRVLIVSPSSLFSEVLAESIGGREAIELSCIDPKAAAGVIARRSPDVIVIDEALPHGQLGRLLGAARALQSALIMLVNQQGNDFVVLDCHRATMRKADDLISTIEKHIDPRDTPHNNPGPQHPGDRARATAGSFGFLAAMLNVSPDSELVRRLRTLGPDVFVLTPEQGATDTDIDQGLRAMAGFIESTRGQPEGEVGQALTVDWTRLFRGVSSAHGPRPPYEGLYAEGGHDDLTGMRAIHEIYLDAGVARSEKTRERADYLGLELDYLSHMAEMEADALDAGDEARAAEYAERARIFLMEHPSRWVGNFCRTAIAFAETDFYRGLLQIIGAIFSDAAL